MGGQGGGGYGGYNAGMQGGGGRQIYVSNVCSLLPTPAIDIRCPGCSDEMRATILTYWSQLPYTVGWQDLKDLFRQAGKESP